MELENENPNIYKKTENRLTTKEEEDDAVIDAFDAREIFGEHSINIHVKHF